MKLVLASSNQGKLEELRGLLADTGIELVAQSDLGVADADETGTTFVENALIKARHASLQTGLPALADDSGICVDALNGAPGLYSARYAGEHGHADRNIDKLLDALKDVAGEQRGAHFYCVLVLLRHAHDPQRGQSAAEMPLDEKNRISHRGKALAGLKQRLPATL